MIELRLEGLPADVTAAHERLASTFEVLSVSKDYPNRDSKLIRRFVKVEVKPGSGLDQAKLKRTIEALLSDSHHDLRQALTITPQLEAWHAGLQTGLMELARLSGVIPDSEPAPKAKAKRKPGRKKQQQQGFWLKTELGAIHCLADPAMADDPEFRAAIEAMVKAAKAEADKFNEGRDND